MLAKLFSTEHFNFNTSRTVVNMNTCREKFKHNFVKPLYRPKCGKEKSNKIAVTHSVIEVDGSEIIVNSKVMSEPKNRPINVFSDKIRENLATSKRFLLNNYVNNNSKRMSKDISMTSDKTISSKYFQMVNNIPEIVTNNIDPGLINFDKVSVTY